MNVSVPNELESRLYIIGNGFDLHHGIASSYRNFENHVKNNNAKLYSNLRLYFNYDYLWSNFEAALAEIDVRSIQIESKDFIDNLNPDVLRRRGWYAYAEAVEDRIELITIELQNEFLK